MKQVTWGATNLKVIRPVIPLPFLREINNYWVYHLWAKITALVSNRNAFSPFYAFSECTRVMVLYFNDLRNKREYTKILREVSL